MMITRTPLAAMAALRSCSKATATTRATAATTTLAKTRVTIVSAVSGGVDSSVATALLHEQYRDDHPSVTLQTVHMSNWDPHDDDSLAPQPNQHQQQNQHQYQYPSACTVERDWHQANQLAQHLQLTTPCHRITALASTYWVTTFEPFVEALQRYGIMGNPDVHCNTHVKFGALPKYLQNRYGTNNASCDNDVWLATGHYARLWHCHNNNNLISNTTSARTIPECVEQAVEISRDYATLDALRTQHHHTSTTGSNKNNNNPLLLAAADRSKDQSYFLSGCSGASFRKVLFPLGDYYKKNHPSTSTQPQQLCRPTVREIAAQLQLPAATRRESMGLCFVGKRPSGFRSFIQHYLPAPKQRLQFVDIDTGRVLHQTEHPEHAVLYTPGQGARLAGLSEKYFCVHHNHHDDHNNNNNDYHTITVCAGTHHPALYSDTLVVQFMHWIVNQDTTLTALIQIQSSSSHNNNNLKIRSLRAQCRVRHLQPLVDCTLVFDKNDDEGSAVTVGLDHPLRGITVGQQAVFYTLDGLVCLGGGPIHSRGPSYWEQGRALLPLDQLHPAGHNDTSILSYDYKDDDDDDDDAVVMARRTTADG